MFTPALSVALIAFLVLWSVALYNGLVRKRNMVEEAWSGIDVQLKRRTDLIPSLISTVRGYVAHEQQTLAELIRLRSKAQEPLSRAETAQTHGLLGSALGQLLALAESYPDLKANNSFIQLQSALEETEEQIQLARRYYNGTVRELNIAVETFPSRLIAQPFRISKAEFFELESIFDRSVPKLTFPA